MTVLEELINFLCWSGSGSLCEPFFTFLNSGRYAFFIYDINVTHQGVTL